ncbi:MAG: ABC transporter permease [Clostridia bacterium]|nr:ABC transporter permease [Clostridia bacterium]
MTVFKTFLRILNKNKGIVILYTVVLLVFAGINMKSNNTVATFEASRPDILIVNRDEEVGITKDLIKYIKENSNIPTVADNEEARNDALFYVDTHYILYIPENYHNDFMNEKAPELEVKKRESYNAEYAEMIIKRYISVASTYQKSISSEEELIAKVNETLSKKAEANITSKLDTTALNRAAFYYNFESYAILACLIYIICLVLSVFNSQKVHKRIAISSTDYKKHNRQLLLSNCVYAFFVWSLYVIASFVLIGKDVMMTKNGAIFIVNSFIFTICATSISFFIGSLVSNKNAVTGIVNVVALGSSFLCGVFVPTQYLPDSVKAIARVIPTYYYVKTNDAASTMEIINFETLKPLMINMGVLLGFAAVFVIASNIVAAKKRKIG